jgi:hypothetical protein
MPALPQLKEIARCTKVDLVWLISGMGDPGTQSPDDLRKAVEEAPDIDVARDIVIIFLESQVKENERIIGYLERKLREK